MVIVDPAGDSPEDELTPDVFEVWPENAETIEWWMRLQTQWRTGMSGAVGMEYGAWLGLFNLYQVKDQRRLFEDLQLMEYTVLNKLGEDQ